MKKLLYVLLAPLLLSACNRSLSDDRGDIKNWDGYKPVYMTMEQVKDIRLMSAKDLKKPGKIYTRGNYIFVNELSKGVHIIDNTDPAAPVSKGFINIPGNVDIAIKGTIMYADNYTDLVAIDISDPKQVRVTKRIEKVYTVKNYPEMNNVRFECPDASKGIIVGWEKTDAKDLKCYR